MSLKHTQGEWSLPHLAVEDSSCNCGFVLSEGYCGAIATVHWSKDRKTENGDNPPLEEAIANAKLIHAAPDMLEALMFVLERLDWEKTPFSVRVVAKGKIEKAIGKATK